MHLGSGSLFRQHQSRCTSAPLKADLTCVHVTGSSDDDVFYDRTVRDGSGGAAAPLDGGGKRAKRAAAPAIDAATLSAQREALHAEQSQLRTAIEQESLLAAEVCASHLSGLALDAGPRQSPPSKLLDAGARGHNTMSTLLLPTVALKMSTAWSASHNRACSSDAVHHVAGDGVSGIGQHSSPSQWLHRCRCAGRVYERCRDGARRRQGAGLKSTLKQRASEPAFVVHRRKVLVRTTL